MTRDGLESCLPISGVSEQRNVDPAEGARKRERNRRIVLSLALDWMEFVWGWAQKKFMIQKLKKIVCEQEV